jgi:hypothetical protein
MTALPSTYDAWRLSGPDESDAIGTEPGDQCNRVHEPDDDAPRGYRPRPCGGLMVDDGGAVICESCGVVA